MSYIPPTEAVKLIAQLFPFTADPTKDTTLGFQDAASLASILAVVNWIPPELLTVDSARLAAFTGARAGIQYFIDECRTLGNHARGVSGFHVTTLRRVLEACPDHAVPATVATLAFIEPPDLRDGLRADIASVETSFREADWKPATIMAGSVIEALLLWSLQPPQRAAATVEAQVATLVKGGMSKPRGRAVEEWVLHDYIAVSEALGVIKADTAAQLRIAKDFRNLIHPGRAIRLATKCDRATALAASAGLEFVIRDLSG